MMWLVLLFGVLWFVGWVACIQGTSNLKFNKFVNALILLFIWPLVACAMARRGTG